MSLRLIIFGIVVLLITSCNHERNNPLDPEYHYTITDIDGNVYNPVVIGKQVWMTENLKTTRYRNGDPIPNVTDNNEWISLNTGAYCRYDNYDSIKLFGVLYNWHAISDNRNIAPTGWHIPTIEEWKTLTNFLGGEEIAGSKLKDSTRFVWAMCSLSETDEVGFKAVPGGYRCGPGFRSIGFQCFFWSSTARTEGDSWGYFTYACDSFFYKCIGANNLGYSVRCIRD